MPDFKPTSEGSGDAGSSAQRKATSPLFNTLPCWQTFSVCWLYSIFTYAYLYIYINTRLSNKSENYIFSFIPLVLYIYIPVQYVCYVIYIYSQLYQVLISQPHIIFLNSKLKGPPVVLQIVQANVQGECARFVHAPLACFTLW